MNTTMIGIAVLIAFVVSFLGICLWALWPSNRQRLKAYGLIPLLEDKDDVE
jgi:cbb3-type cytochrome oxidase subunit 3